MLIKFWAFMSGLLLLFSYQALSFRQDQEPNYQRVGTSSTRLSSTALFIPDEPDPANQANDLFTNQTPLVDMIPKVSAPSVTYELVNEQPEGEMLIQQAAATNTQIYKCQLPNGKLLFANKPCQKVSAND